MPFRHSHQTAHKPKQEKAQHNFRRWSQEATKEQGGQNSHCRNTAQHNFSEWSKCTEMTSTRSSRITAATASQGSDNIHPANAKNAGKGRSEISEGRHRGQRRNKGDRTFKTVSPGKLVLSNVRTHSHEQTKACRKAFAHAQQWHNAQATDCHGHDLATFCTGGDNMSHDGRQALTGDRHWPPSSKIRPNKG